MAYVDCFIIPVPTGGKEAYLNMARTVVPIWIEHGATRVVETWGDDVSAGTLTDFPRAVQAGEDETVVVGWVEWPSKEARDAGNAKIMADPRMSPPDGLPFDGKRLIHAGFAVLLDTADG